MIYLRTHLCLLYGGEGERGRKSGVLGKMAEHTSPALAYVFIGLLFIVGDTGQVGLQIYACVLRKCFDIFAKNSLRLRSLRRRRLHRCPQCWQRRLDVYYAIGDILSLCLRYRSVATKVQQSSLGLYYAIGDLLILCLRYRSDSTKIQQGSLGAFFALRIPAPLFYAIVQRAQEQLSRLVNPRLTCDANTRPRVHH